MKRNYFFKCERKIRKVLFLVKEFNARLTRLNVVLGIFFVDIEKQFIQSAIIVILF